MSTVSRFAARQALGSGTFGTIMRAHDRELDIDVAIKRLHATALADDELRAEFRALAHVGHPNVVTFYELLADDEGPFFTMECLPDTGRMRQPGPWTGAEVVATFVPIARGLEALHQAGVAHGDLKPSNVLTTADDRVVLTDFGLASVLGKRGVVGFTPRCAAPELLDEGPASPAADAYAFGVMLHDALSATPAFADPTSVFVEKSLQPRLDGSRLPAPFGDLVAALSHVDPNSRPSMSEVASIVSGIPDIAIATPWMHRAVTLIGRDNERSRLRAIVQRARVGIGSVVLLSGEPCIGKSAILEAAAAEHGAPVVRCFANERIPGILRRDLDDAFGVGRETMFATLAIDDIGWMDDESMHALAALLDRREASTVVIATLRSDGIDHLTQTLTALLDAGRGTRPALIQMPIGGLSEEDLTSIAVALGVETQEATLSARSARGNPLAAYQMAAGPWFERTLDQLTTQSRRLLELVALVASRCPAGVAARAADLDEVGYLCELQRLRARRLVTTTYSTRAGEQVAIAHDSVRAAMLARLSHGEMQTLHRRLAREFAGDEREAGGHVGNRFRTIDIGRAAVHFESAGDLARGAVLAASAANAEGERPGRVAFFLEMVLRLTRPEEVARDALRLRLAEALSAAGRSGEAGRVFQALACEGAPTAARDMTRRALQHLLLAGHHAEARDILRAALHEIDAVPPAGLVRRVLPILWYYRTREGRDPRIVRRPAQTTAADCDALDVLHSASLGFAMIDPLTSAYLQVRHMRRALRKGDDGRLLRALAIHMVHSATSFVDPKRLEVCTALASTLSARHVSAESAATLQAARAAAQWVLGELTEAQATASSAAEAVRALPGLHWEANSIALVRLALAEERGDWGELAASLPMVLDDASERGDRYLQHCVHARSVSFDRLLRGDYEGSVRAATWAGGRRPARIPPLPRPHSRAARLQRTRAGGRRERGRACAAQAGLPPRESLSRRLDPPRADPGSASAGAPRPGAIEATHAPRRQARRAHQAPMRAPRRGHRRGAHRHSARSVAWQLARRAGEGSRLSRARRLARMSDASTRDEAITELRAEGVHDPEALTRALWIGPASTRPEDEQR